MLKHDCMQHLLVNLFEIGHQGVGCGSVSQILHHFRDLGVRDLLVNVLLERFALNSGLLKHVLLVAKEFALDVLECLLPKFGLVFSRFFLALVLHLLNALHAFVN